MDISDLAKQVSDNLKEQISIRKEIKDGLSSWKKRLFGSSKAEEVVPQVQPTQQSTSVSSSTVDPHTIDVNNLSKKQIESIERLTEVLNQSLAVKVGLTFKTLQKYYVAMMNEPSIGMYYIQEHNKNVILNAVEEKQELAKTNRKLQFTTEQLFHTKKELIDISKLNGEWSTSMASCIDQLQKALE